LCPKEEPSDLEVLGTGKLVLHNAYKAYGEKILIQAQTNMKSNNTKKDNVPPLSLDYDCCGLERRPHKMSDIHLELPTKNTVNRLKDLQLARHKFKEVDRLNYCRTKVEDERENLTTTYPFYHM
jgi:hypothetical protein